MSTDAHAGKVKGDVVRETTAPAEARHNLSTAANLTSRDSNNIIFGMRGQKAPESHDSAMAGIWFTPNHAFSDKGMAAQAPQAKPDATTAAAATNQGDKVHQAAVKQSFDSTMHAANDGVGINKQKQQQKQHATA